MLASVLLLAVSARAAGPVGEPAGPLQEQRWLVPSPVPGVEMVARLFRPMGKGPFPLAVLNHGSDEDAALRRRQVLPDWPELVGVLLAHGYAVLQPLRPGHGETGGTYLESQGWCGRADFVVAGAGGAASIAAAVDYMRLQDFIAPDRLVVVGNSAGGWASLAFAAQAPAGLAGVIDFAGGRGGRDRGKAGSNCSPDRLVAAAARFGTTTEVPTLWLYSDNDSYFPPALSQRMAEAFAGAGGMVDYRLLGPVRGDGHALIATEGDEASWKPAVEGFLKRLSAQ